MAGQGIVQDKTGILCGPDDQCLEGMALVSKVQVCSRGQPASVNITTG